MRIDKVKIEDFKNLKKFEIDIDENQWENVFLGQNATGKSNFFEALVLIFKHLDIKLNETPPFEFDIHYICRGNKINVQVKDDKYKFTVWNEFKVIDGETVWSNEKEISRAEFEREKETLLPNHVFIYYSGTSSRLQNVYIEHQKRYYLEIIKPKAKGRKVETLRKIFLVQNIHSKFALLSFFIFGDKKETVLKFLKEELKIVDFVSLLLVLKQPVWSKTKSEKDMFWRSGGLVRTFLEQLWEYSLAPIYNTESIPVSYKQNETQERLYLFISEKEKLEELARTHYKNKIQLFNAFESTYISDLVEDIRVNIKRKTAKKKIVFGEMSEGEQQLLTVFGLLRFLKDEESLILLDEPDTHLNPIWKWKYMEYFKEIVGRAETTQIFINTHDPLVIGSLSKEQIRIFRSDEDGKIKAEQPDIDPKGLGVAGILTSELFGLPTTLDKKTQELLDERNNLLYKESIGELTETGKERIRELFLEINSLGFTFTFKDPMYSKFISAMGKIKDSESKPLSKEEIEKQNETALSILEELFQKEKDDIHQQ